MYHTFYVKGNDVINLRSENNVYSVVGKVSKETRDIENINVLFSTMKQYAGLNNKIHFTDVFVELTRVSDLAKTMKPTSKDKEFLKTYELYKEYYITMLALSYKYKPKTVGKHPKPEDFPTLYTSIAHAKFLSEDILQFPFGNRMLGSLILDAASAMQGKVKITKDNRRQVNVNLIPSDVIKGQYITNEIQSVNSYDEYAKLMAEFGHYITLPTQKDRVEKKLVTLANSVPGSPFIDFTYQNLNGENISKADFKGKIVVLDFWATWCGPCKQEEPYFEKLAEEFQGKDVVFVAISTDRDKAAWDKYVKLKKDILKEYIYMLALRMHCLLRIKSQVFHVI